MRKYLLLLFTATAMSCSNAVTPEEKTLLTSKEEFLKYVNQARVKNRKCGSQNFAAALPVIWNSSLEKAAYLHSKDMFENKYFSHISKNGTDPGARILAQNYPFKFYAENIYAAAGFKPSPAEIIEQWLNSPMHCVNIMTPHFKEVAVGEYNNYWTQLFGSK